VIVPIIMGSKSDLAHARKIAEALAVYGVATELRIASAHKSTRYLLMLLEAYEADPQPKIYITIAGRSNALSGVVDANVAAPVIACPPPSEAFGGADIFSSLRMPSGVAPAVVLDPENAALLAVKMLALADPGLRDQVAAAQERARARIEADDRGLRR
jgi:5-(carboxyamino)imidazole ribonucleotide mutase